MNYFKAGLAVGQSRLLVEDPLRDGRGRMRPGAVA
jgi:hypothetical protein